jgi:uncharacterized protein
MTPKLFVSKLFETWEAGDSGPFFAALVDDLTWTAAGTTPISGTYHGKAAYIEKCYGPLLKIFTGPTQCRVKRIFSDDHTVIVEWHGETPTSLKFVYSQDYCWIVRVSEDVRQITEVTGYFDTALVSELFKT